MEELADEIRFCTDINICSETISALGSFGRDALEYLLDVKGYITDPKIIQAINHEITRINEQSPRFLG